MTYKLFLESECYFGGEVWVIVGADKGIYSKVSFIGGPAVRSQQQKKLWDWTG